METRPSLSIASSASTTSDEDGTDLVEPVGLADLGDSDTLLDRTEVEQLMSWPAVGGAHSRSNDARSVKVLLNITVIAAESPPLVFRT